MANSTSDLTSQERSLSVLGGALIVAGTSIGGGMLALPVLTAPAGFVPSLSVLALCWLFMTATGLLFLELCLWTKKRSNFVTLADITLGTPGKIANLIIYLFLFYCLLVAYLVGGGQLLITLIPSLSINTALANTLFLILFGSLVFLRKTAIDRINRFLMAGLIGSFLGFIFIGIPHFNLQNLTHSDWSFAFLSVPVAFTSFGYQGTMPTLANWMHYDPKKIRTSIILGTTLAFITYLVWEALILGIVPTFGEYGLLQTLDQGRNAIMPLQYVVSSPAVVIIGQAFAFFALVTSFLGVSIGLIDFIADGTGIQPHGLKRLWLALLTFLPPLIISFFNPYLFLEALDWAGGIGCATLLGLMPILMVALGRYRYRFPKIDQLPGGKFTLTVLAVFVSTEIICELIRIISKMLIQSPLG